MPVNRYSYLLLFLVPALLPLAWWLGGLTGRPDLLAFLPLVVLQGVVPLLDWIVGRDERNVEASAAARRAEDRFFRALTLACVPVQLALLGWATWVACIHAPFGAAGLLGWTVSTGYIGGILAINVGHELIHKRSALERFAGGLLLSTVSYGGFKVEHVRGHHVNVSTPEDASSAALGQSIFSFLPRAIASNVVHAWKLEARRLARLGRPAWHPANELWRWSVLTLLWAGLATLLAGPAGLLFFAGQSLAAIASLETVNYIEHYGLRRRRLPDGRYERPDPTHSWNSDAVLTNLMLLQLARHSDHHANATRRYQVLRHHDESPQLPAGYATMFLLAWIPPLWRHVMDPRARAFEARRGAQVSDAASVPGPAGAAGT